MNEQYIDALKALAEPHRLRLFWLLIHVDQCITLAEAMDVTGDTQYNASRNLKILYKAGLLTQEKRGKWVYYRLASQEHPQWVFLVDSVRALPAADFAEVTSRCRQRLAMRKNNECVVGPNSDDWLAMLSNTF
ncbi:metalloregulator ArsR/SmtB family transcription factor [Coraliomargarita sp. SDUM461004]|uniref:Metalloregulator ArsR/SmtB family transcription factor n=1 Tax=Thalassobacterium sedimentorum TaxID=3041258 RepID=A0ABU1APQ0_9BACT|nr:metalloregulator ArsR/SmtB family transcription factor [Coraliomargarita sp. SDUM461004]MDQ8195726.1 metalloregulator ArsR/SmtB family transcription factor [Coraliomargarita sp. SDUM461004]